MFDLLILAIWYLTYLFPQVISVFMFSNLTKMVMQFPDNKVMDQVDFANSPLQQQTIGFTEVISKVSDFLGETILCFFPFTIHIHCPVMKCLSYQITSYSHGHGRRGIPSKWWVGIKKNRKCWAQRK